MMGVQGWGQGVVSRGSAAYGDGGRAALVVSLTFSFFKNKEKRAEANMAKC